MSLPKIFINYRIKDTAYQADFLYDFLRQYLPEENLFMDIEGIGLGANFEDKINYVLDNADIVVALIGSYWEEEINKRIDENREDWVVDEIVESVDAKKRVIPVAFDRQTLPTIADLKITARKVKKPIEEFLKFQMLQISRRHRYKEAKYLAEDVLMLKKLPIRNNIPEEVKHQLQKTQQELQHSTAERAKLENTLNQKEAQLSEATLQLEKLKQNATLPERPNQEQTGQNKDYTETINGVSFKMIWVEGGSFMMGSDKDKSEQPIHKVSLQGFYMAETQVTQELYEAIVGKNLSKFKGEQNPVETVSWEDAQDFLDKLNEQTGSNYRLPSEAQWEYAAGLAANPLRVSNPERVQYAGTNKEKELKDYAWFDENSGKKTHPVKTKKPNALGLYDMSGNVWEWCEDKWHDNYNGAPNNEEAWIEDGSRHRVLRGGSWFNNTVLCRVADRYWYYPLFRFVSFGFRIIRSVP